MCNESISVLIGGFFPRSHSLEGTGSLIRALAEGVLKMGWQLDLVLPEGSGNFPAEARIHSFDTGPLRGIRNYCKTIANVSRNVDCVLLVENNPNMVFVADSSRCIGKTFCMFCTPLQGFNVITELGICKQAVLHWVAKHHLLSHLNSWRHRRCFVASEYQALQLRRLGCQEVHTGPVASVSKHANMFDRAEARRKLDLPDVPIVGYLGHFSRAKGVDTLLAAFDAHPGPAVLALAYSGKGRLKRDPAETLARLEREGRVRMFGVVQPCEFLAACDVVALPYPTSSVYHQPQVMLESFAAGTAVITSDIGGFCEVVQQSRTGLLTRPRDIAALTAAIGSVLSDLPRTHKMGRRAREVFEESAAPEVFLDILAELICK